MTNDELIAHKPIPQGWRFYSADFSIEDSAGYILLCRDKAGTKWWHSLDETGKANIDLYVSGYGKTVNEAINNAIKYIPTAYQLNQQSEG